MDTMTKRMAMQAVVEGNVTAEVKEFFATEIEKMDTVNAKRREKNAEKSKKNHECLQTVLDALTGEFKTGKALAEELDGAIEREDGKALNYQFIASVLKGAVAEGTVVKGKTKAGVGYALAALRAE